MNNCKECPFIKEDYDRLFEYYKTKGYKEEDFESWLLNSMYCEKVGGKILYYGMCSESCPIKDEKENTEEKTINEPLLKSKARRTRKNTKRYKRKLKYKAKNISSYPGVAYGMTKEREYSSDEDEIAYYKKCYKSSHATRYRDNKKASNKRVRKNKNFSSKQKSCYKKLYDYKYDID